MNIVNASQQCNACKLTQVKHHFGELVTKRLYNIRIICKNTWGTKLDSPSSVDSPTAGSSEDSNGFPVTKKGGKRLTNYVTVSLSKRLCSLALV